MTELDEIGISITTAERDVIEQNSAINEIPFERCHPSQMKGQNITNIQQFQDKFMKYKSSSTDRFREAYIQNKSKKLDLL